MVFGILTAVAACPAIIGTTEAIRHGQKQNNREHHRGQKYHLTASLLKRSVYSQQFEGAYIVLKKQQILHRHPERCSRAVLPGNGQLPRFPRQERDMAQDWIRWRGRVCDYDQR